MASQESRPQPEESELEENKEKSKSQESKLEETKSEDSKPEKSKSEAFKLEEAKSEDSKLEKSKSEDSKLDAQSKKSTAEEDAAEATEAETVELETGQSDIAELETTESEAVKSPTAKKTPKKQLSPRNPKGFHRKERKPKDKSKDIEIETETEKEPNEKTQKKYEKSIKKSHRLKSEEETALNSKKVNEEEPSTIKTKKEILKHKERAAAVKRKNLRLKPKIKTKSKLKVKDSEEDLREEESLEEKGHNKDLLDTVYHKMELDRTKEPETGAEIKYSNYEELSERVVGQVNSLMDSLSETFQLYKSNEVMLSFNGGKDCTVVLHLLHKFYQMNACLKNIKLPTLYITDPDAFEEVDDFVKDCEKLFNIELIRKPGPIKKALEEICKERPNIKAVFMGCRRTDPYCQDLKTMQPTDAGWPPLMRINPIIDWKCRDVWQYMYMYNVPYCSLYQKGYTSIGNKKDTLPNPYLRIIDNTTGKIVDYRPGHELIDNDELERAGRFKIPK